MLFHVEEGGGVATATTNDATSRIETMPVDLEMI